MDYTKKSLGFQLAKTLRYIRLYGFSRTLVKIRGQYHMRRHLDPLPERTLPLPTGGHVGLIGCGNFAYSNIAYVLRKSYGRVIRACMDLDVHRAASLAKAYGSRYYTQDAEEILCDPNIDLVFIASNHASHAEYAIAALRAGKAVHIEKPHCVDEDQLLRLCRAMSETQGRVALGFNRPNSRIGSLIRQHLGQQPGTAMLNWFIAGHAIDPDHWYFRPEEGGRILGNLCHWTDFLLQMVPDEDRFPIRIQPTRHTRADCDIAVTYLFGDGSLAVLTFSAKGHTFEGVRERFAAHKGDALIAMDNFKDLTVEIVDKKLNYSGLFRDHGHSQRIVDSYALVKPGAVGESVSYVWETGQLFLKTKQALELMEVITLDSFEKSGSPLS